MSASATALPTRSDLSAIVMCLTAADYVARAGPGKRVDSRCKHGEGPLYGGLPRPGEAAERLGHSWIRGPLPVGVAGLVDVGGRRRPHLVPSTGFSTRPSVGWCRGWENPWSGAIKC